MCFPKVSKERTAANNFKEKFWNTHFVTQEQSAEGCRNFYAEIIKWYFLPSACLNFAR